MTARNIFKSTRHRAAAATASQFIDYDNDGLLDLISVFQGTLRVLRNTGDGWADVSFKATSGISAEARRLMTAGDIDGDGDTDIIFGGITV